MKQSVLPYEIIVVDNGSTDATAQIMRCHYSKIQFFYERKVGVSAARNFLPVLRTLVAPIFPEPTFLTSFFKKSFVINKPNGIEPSKYP